MNAGPEDREPLPPMACRLCGGEAKFYGRQTVLGRHRVAYFECGACGSLQTEDPHWLDQAYQVEGVGLDVGACQRSLNLALEVSACLTVLGFGPEEACLDYGAGLGLFARLMRDRGWNFHASDKYIKPFFMDRFPGVLDQKKWSALSAFEVFEHLVQPGSEIAGLFRVDPDILFFTTQVWRGQGLDWWYIVPQGGQHIFFYSEKALQLLAEKHGYVLFELSSVKFFLSKRRMQDEHPLNPLEKIAYRMCCRQIARGRFRPSGALRLHVLRDRKIMRRLALALFGTHQRDAFRWTERDFQALQAGAASPPKLP